MLIILILLLTGMTIGVISSFFGVGGGAIAIPVLYTIFPKVPPQVIISSSLGMIFLNSLLNCYHYYRSGKAPIKKAFFSLTITMVAGVLIGAQIALTLEPRVIKLLFAVILVIVAIRTIIMKVDSNQAGWVLENKDLPKLALTGALGGITSALTGLGGGAVMVPLFLTVLRMPFSWVPVYSNYAMAAGTLVGVIRYMIPETQEHFQVALLNNFQVGHANFIIILGLFIGASVTTKIGVYLAAKVPPAITKKLFAGLLTLIALRIFATA